MVVKGAIRSEVGHSEWFLNYYDIFIRNAFGNYRDILREISYNPLMAENLSFLGSKSSAYMLERFNVKTSAGKVTQSNVSPLNMLNMTDIGYNYSPEQCYR